jgi:hypothetical protein
MLLAPMAFGAQKAGPLEGYGAPKSKCRTCERSADLRASVPFALPEHAIVFDVSNGVFWMSSRLLVVDLDRAEAITYRYPQDAERPTALEIAGRRGLSDDQIRELTAKAKLVWNPPPPKKLGTIHSDTFQTLYVLDGAVLGKWLELGGGDDWFVDLRESLSKLLAP